MKNKKPLFALALFIMLFTSCTISSESADNQESQKQEKLQRESVAETGLPNIHNFQEKKMVKMLYELRDNPNLINYAYLFSEVTGKYVYFGKCIGYGIPYSTQFSNPEKRVGSEGDNYGHNLPQAEPNGLFMPSSTEGTWLMMVNPSTSQPVPVYVEPKVIVTPFKLDEK